MCGDKKKLLISFSLVHVYSFFVLLKTKQTKQKNAIFPFLKVYMNLVQDAASRFNRRRQTPTIRRFRHPHVEHAKIVVDELDYAFFVMNPSGGCSFGVLAVVSIQKFALLN